MASGIDQYLRAHVTLPDGRVIHGRRPGLSGGQLLEHKLRDVLAKQIRGITEAVLPYGRADAMTADRVFEVEPARQWRHAVRQVLAYHVQCGLPPAIALFGGYQREAVEQIYLKLRDGQPRVELWWYDGPRWLRITSRTACRTFSAPPPLSPLSSPP